MVFVQLILFDGEPRFVSIEEWVDDSGRVAKSRLYATPFDCQQSGCQAAIGADELDAFESIRMLMQMLNDEDTFHDVTQVRLPRQRGGRKGMYSRHESDRKGNTSVRKES